MSKDLENPEAPEGGSDEEEGRFEEMTVLEAVVFSNEDEVGDRDDEPDHEEGAVEEIDETETDEREMHGEGDEGVGQQSGEAGGERAGEGDEENDRKGEGLWEVALIEG